MNPKRPAYVRAICEVHKNYSAKGSHGYVVLEFERASEFAFVSAVSWPEGDNFSSAVETAVREALSELKQSQSFLCRLTEIRFHEIDSSAVGFSRAARQATIAAFSQ
jgi:hypothetical protein